MTRVLSLAAIVEEAMSRDASLDADVARLLAEEALAVMTTASEVPRDAPALARLLFARHPSVGVTAANVVAVATLGV